MRKVCILITDCKYPVFKIIMESCPVGYFKIFLSGKADSRLGISHDLRKQNISCFSPYRNKTYPDIIYAVIQSVTYIIYNQAVRYLIYKIACKLQVVDCLCFPGNAGYAVVRIIRKEI